MHKLKNNPISNDDLVNKKYVDNSILTKQDKTDNALDTTDKTVVGAINEINGNALDNVTFSADYKNIIINRKSGLNPYTIPISAIIHNAKIIELNDVDSTNIGDGKTLVYDGATQKHKYVDSTGTVDLSEYAKTADVNTSLNNKVDKTSILSTISSNPSDDKLLSEKAIKSELDKLKTNFQDGVDTVYDAVVAKGTTPVDKTPSEIAIAISKILGGDLTSIYNALTNKGLNMSGTESDEQIASIITDLMTIKSFTTQIDSTTFVFNCTKDTIKDTELVDTIDAGLILEISSKELTSVESGGYIEFAEIDKSEYNNILIFV